MQTAPPDQLVGRVLDGRYRILDRLARGGMSTVYAALDERLDRKVALKVMSPALGADPAFAGRFEREARISAQLSHPNIVAVYDQGTDPDGHTYLVMELVRGRTLRDVIRENGPLSPAAAVSLMEPVLGALASAHRANFVHKDVKPENILISDDGAVKVTDFGLARAIESNSTSTRTGLMMGTVAYCAPEQIAGGNTDSRTDVYAAGVVLFELLTGSTPYVGDNAMQIAYQHVHSDVPAPSSRRPDLPPQLDELVLRATNRLAGGRPFDAGALLAELHTVRTDLALPVVAVPRAGSGAARTTAVAAMASPTSVTAPTQAVVYGDALHHTAVHGAAIAAPAPVGEGGAKTSGKRAKAAKKARSRPSPYESPQRRTHARRRALVAFLVVLLLSFATAYGTWWWVSGRYHALPGVAGQAQDAAVAELTHDGFVLKSPVIQQFSETVASGRVIATDPAEGTRLKDGGQIQLIVSKGPERFKLPTVHGTYDDVAAQLKDIPVKLVRSDAADPTGDIAVGKLIRIDPPAGSSVKRNDVVTVFISTGPPMVQVPDVSGKSVDDATAALQAAGFKVDASQRDWSDSVDAGNVISQSPDANGQALKFSTVKLVVSKGPSATIPSDIVPGTDAGTAKSELDALGFNTVVHKRNKPLLDFGGYVVERVDPGPGTVVAKGSQVDLYVK